MARILIVDDSPEMRHVLSALLMDHGLTIQVVGDGESALSIVEQQPPDLLVLDLIMPKMDGYTVLRQLDTMGVMNDMKILVLSAKTSEGDLVRGYRLGADHYLTKPFGADELLDAVTDMLATPKAELKRRTEAELDKAQLLSRLETIFSDL
ncbi:MAG: response regulator transcription factor [Actinomycetota bacterium]